MTDEEALVILKENRPDKPTKTRGRQLQAAIDQITDSYEMEDLSLIHIFRAKM